MARLISLELLVKDFTEKVINLCRLKYQKRLDFLQLFDSFL